MRYQYDYDIKDDLINLIQIKNDFTGANELKYYLDKYTKEKDILKRNLMKFCIYKLSAELSDREIHNFDCDVSKDIIISFQRTYNWLSDSLFCHQKDGYGNVISSKYELLKDNMVFRGDTMTSIWTILKGYVKLKTGISRISENDTWEWFILRESNNIQLSSNAGLFLELGHTLGNFIPVPLGFNVGRSNFGKWDSWDLTLFQIYKWYSDNSQENEYYNNQALERLFTNDRNKQSTVLNCQEWLSTFRTWNDFVKENYLQSFVDRNGVPKQFFKNHTLEYPQPQTLQEYEEFFRTVNECIAERGKMIIKVLEQKGYEVEKGEQNENYQSTRINRKLIFPFSNIKKGVDTVKDEMNKRSLQGISYCVGYLMRCIGIIFSSYYYIQFLIKVGYNAPFERENINYMPMGRYENVAWILLAMFILTTIILCISYIKNKKGIKRFLMIGVTVFIVVLCILPVIYTVAINIIQNMTWFETWLNSDYIGHTDTIKFYLKLYGIICILFVIIPSVWLLIDSDYRYYMKYCVKSALLTVALIPTLLIVLETGSLLIIVGIISSSIFAFGWNIRCSYCRKMFALRRARVEVISREDISVLVDIENRGKNGETLQTSQYVPGIREMYDVVYTCKHCGSETRKRKKREYPKI